MILLHDSEKPAGAGLPFPSWLGGDRIDLLNPGTAVTKQSATIDRSQTRIFPVGRACGKRGADVRPDFNLNRKVVAAMGYR
jgi:hypothetical protein